MANVAVTGHAQIKAPVKVVENYCVENDHWQTWLIDLSL